MYSAAAADFCLPRDTTTVPSLLGCAVVLSQIMSQNKSSLRFVVTYFVTAMRCKNHVVPRLSEQVFGKTGINCSGALEKPRRLYTGLKRPSWWELGSSRFQWKGTVLSVLLAFQRETRVQLGNWGRGHVGYRLAKNLAASTYILKV